MRSPERPRTKTPEGRAMGCSRSSHSCQTPADCSHDRGEVRLTFPAEIEAGVQERPDRRKSVVLMRSWRHGKPGVVSEQGEYAVKVAETYASAKRLARSRSSADLGCGGRRACHALFRALRDPAAEFPSPLSGWSSASPPLRRYRSRGRRAAEPSQPGEAAYAAVQRRTLALSPQSGCSGLPDPGRRRRFRQAGCLGRAAAR